MEFENLLALIRTVSDSKLTDLKYEEDGVKIRLSKKSRPAAVQAAAAVSESREADAEEEVSVQESADSEGQIVTSPLVGVFYAAPAEDAEPFVSVGDSVKKGQTLAIIEAMKLMNEIESEYDGTIVKIYPENGQAVEYGQPLFCIR